MADVFPDTTPLDTAPTETTPSSTTETAPPVGEANTVVSPASDAVSTEELSDRDLLNKIAEDQAQHRAEVAALREELAAAKQPAVSVTAPSATAQTPEELAAARAEEISKHDYYCPGCGKLVDYRQQCQGRPEAPHPAIEVVSTDELKQDDTSKHTAAPVVIE